MEYKDILSLTKSDFENLPEREWDKPVYCDSIVLVPTEDEHDSGFCCIRVIAMKGGIPICCCDDGSDVININGIGGTGEYQSEAWNNRMSIKKIPISSWNIDLLP